MIGRLHHVVIDCPDPAALAAFYSEVLGLPVTYRSDDWVVISKDDMTSGVAFQLAPNHQPPDWPNPDRPQQFHLDVMVDDIVTANRVLLRWALGRWPEVTTSTRTPLVTRFASSLGRGGRRRSVRRRAAREPHCRLARLGIGGSGVWRVNWLAVKRPPCGSRMSVSRVQSESVRPSTVLTEPFCGRGRRISVGGGKGDMRVRLLASPTGASQRWRREARWCRDASLTGADLRIGGGLEMIAITGQADHHREPEIVDRPPEYLGVERRGRLRVGGSADASSIKAVKLGDGISNGSVGRRHTLGVGPWPAHVSSLNSTKSPASSLTRRW